MNKVAEIDLGNLTYNYHQFKSFSKREVFPVLKANAYGHGDIEVAKTLEKAGAKLVCVASIDEALHLVNHIKMDILIFGYTDIEDIKAHHHSQFIYTMGSFEWFNQAETLDFKIRVHLKVNTGMNRFGFKEIESMQHVLVTKHCVEGIYTHFSSSDESIDITKKQIIRFEKILGELNFSFKYIHASNTDGIDKSDVDFLNAVRVGIGLYGYCECVLKLKPVLSLYTVVKHVDTITKGEAVGYNQVDVLDYDTYFAMLPIGYADGFDVRNYGLDVYINNKPYRILGKICMDQMMIEVDETINIGDRVELIGPNRSLESISKHMGVIKYVVLTALGSRIKRIYK